MDHTATSSPGRDRLGPCAYQKSRTGILEHCDRPSVVTWESRDPNSSAYATAGACGDARHAAQVQAWVAKNGRGPVRVAVGNPELVWQDPDDLQGSLLEGLVS